MTQKEKCQRAFRRYRAAQVHASAIMALPMKSLSIEMVESAVDFLNATHDEYRVCRALTECDRLCVDQAMYDEDATLCPHAEGVDPERRERLIRVVRKVRAA